MAEFKVYSVLGYQLEPEIVDPPERDELLPYINNSVGFYIDLSDLRIICSFEADSSHVSRNKQSFIAEYVADYRDELLMGVVNHINELEAESSDGTWELITSDDSVIWNIERAKSRTLEDLGLDLGKELVLESLLGEGVKLDMGMVGHREAAVAITHFVQETEIEAEIAVSSNGRTAAVSDVELVMDPGSETNFTPLTSETRTKVASRLEKQEENIRDRFESEMLSEIESIIDSNISTWGRYRELSDLETALRTNPPRDSTTGFRTDAARRILDLNDAVRENRKPDGFRLDPKALAESTKTELLESVHSEVRDQKDRIEANAKSLIKSEFITAIKELQKLDPAVESKGLRNARSILEGRSEQSPDLGPVKSIKQYKSALDETTLLTGQQKHDLVDEVVSRIDDRLSEIKENESSRLINRFERSIDDIDSSNQLDEAKCLKYALRLLNTDSNSNKSNEESSIANTNQNNLSVPQFVDALSQLQENKILSETDKSQIRSQVRELLNNSIRQLRTERVERYQNRLSRNISNVREDEISIDKKHRLLENTKRLCENQDSVNEIPDELKIFSSWINKLSRDELLTAADARRITNEIHDEIVEIQEQLREQKKKETRKNFQSNLRRVKRQASANHEETYSKIEKIHQYLRGHGNEEDLPQGIHFERLSEVVLDLISPRRNDSVGVLSQQDIRELRSNFQNKLEAAKKEIREDKLEQLQEDIDGVISEFRNSRFRNADKVIALEALLEKHTKNTQSKIKLEGSDRDKGYIEDFKDTFTTFNKFERIKDGREVPDVLSSEEVRDFEEYYTEKLESAKSEIETELLDSLQQQVAQSYHESIVEPLEDSNQDPRRYDDAIDHLRNSKSEIRKICNGTVNKNNYLTDRTIADINSLDSEASKELRDRILDYFDSEISKLERSKEEAIEDFYLDSLDTIRRSDEPIDEKLRALKIFKGILLRGEQSTHQLLSETSKLRELRRGLTRDGKKSIQDHIESTQEDLFKQYRQAVTEQVESEFEKLKRSDRKTPVAANTFVEFLDGNRNSLENNKIPELTNSVSIIKKYKQLRKNERAITDTQYEKLASDVRNIATRYTKDDVTSASKGSRISAGAADLSILPPTTTILKAVAILALGILIGIGATSALAPDGSSGAQQGDTPLTSPTYGELNISEDEESRLVVSGTVSGNVSELDLKISGPGLNVNTTSQVSGGEFEERFPGGDSGIYTLELQPSNIDSERFIVTSTVQRTSTTEPPTLELEEPQWRESLDGPIEVNGTTDAQDYTLVIQNETGDVVHRVTNSPSGGTFQEEYVPEEDGPYYISLTVQGDTAVTEMRIVEFNSNNTGNQ